MQQHGTVHDGEKQQHNEKQRIHGATRLVAGCDKREKKIDVDFAVRKL
jgi:hypothetical protein